MALFTKEPDKNLKPEPAKPPVSPGAVAPAPAPVEAASRPPAVPANNANAGASAYLDRGSKVSGKLFFEGPVSIDGQVDGEISASSTIVIGESAIVTAQLKGGSVVVAGKLSGDVIASKRIEIRPTAKVFGNLTAPVLVIHEGAQFEGHCTMQGDSSREERKASTVVSKDEARPVASAGHKQA